VTGVSPATPVLRNVRVRSIAAAMLAVLAVAVAFDLSRLSPLQGAWFDTCERLVPRPVATTPVTIVAIDDKSLGAIGRWPWPRSLVAELVRRIASFSPGAIGLDIVMPEPDPLSPEHALAHVDADAALRERIAALPSNDAQLAAALRSAPTVLAMVGALAPTSQALRAAPILAGDAHGDAAAIERAKARLTSYPSALSSLALLTNAARGWGLISAEDTQGVVRQMPLVANVNGTLVPGLAVEMWRVALGARALRLSVEQGVVRGVEIGRDSFRTEADGSARPGFSGRRPERFVSALDVLNGTADGDLLRRSFVLIGVTGLALGDYVWTPVAKMPGVEVHAQVLENMSERTFLARPPAAPFVEAAALLVAGGLLVALMPGWPVRYGALAAAACVLAFGALSYAAFRHQRLLFDAATPAVGLALLFATLLALQLAASTRHRKALQRVLQREREEAARVAGELQAARRVQLETLPRADGLRDPRVELAAAMEPALEVGGDLYDFYLLDEERLFFMLGDVSGKGLAASIFMAVSKALCKSTILRAEDADLGLLLSRAYAEVGRDNPAALFVAVFAAVLDLRTGMLDYCNAGQENPWRRDTSDGTLTRLAGGGGPPLCVVDDFAYRSMRLQLQPGELVCVVSDGVTEANDAGGAMYGAARVATVLARVSTAAQAIDALRDDVNRFAAGALPSDDRTVLVLVWRGP
jgi:CHASE2 domain-containing sensor protein/serine phosphatase RsbU (regulator of sigma subunit)